MTNGADTVAQIIASASIDIAPGAVYRGGDHRGRIVVLEVSALGEMIWYDDGVLHMVTPCATRAEFYSMIKGMQKS